MYTRHLPHWRQEGATYFVTFRLHDSLPQVKLKEIEAMREKWENNHGGQATDEQYQEFARMTQTQIESWLDQGMGSCCLKDVRAQSILVEALHHRDGLEYELDSYVIMPNHLHLVVRPFDGFALERILQSRKRHTSLEINRALERQGTLWQEESYDRIIRNEEHLYRVIQYIGANPTKAGLTLAQCPRWIRLEWEALGWRFETSAG
jgi:REP element-mobilizing transposase RayT